jgi:hypothetical protein
MSREYIALAARIYDIANGGGTRGQRIGFIARLIENSAHNAVIKNRALCMDMPREPRELS